LAGLRVAEIKALNRRDVDIAGGFIHVGVKISKTRSRRLVPVTPNLLARLQPIAKPAGPVVGEDYATATNLPVNALASKIGPTTA